MQKKQSVTIRVKPNLLPDDEQVFIVGNHEQLGNWRPDAIPMVPNPEGDGYWIREFQFRKNIEIEYKFTRGSWDSEAADESGTPVGNFRFLVDSDVTISQEVDTWRDIARQNAEETVHTRVTGTVNYHRDLSDGILAQRDLIVWLPESYATNSDKHYPVLYMHDGQNVFDPITAYTGYDWQADETATRLIREGRIRDIIIVGIYNTNDRLEEYSASPLGEAYRRFVVETVKPLIDSNYRTLPGRVDTATIGSSMGGLVSFLLAWHHPDIFGMASCLSPSFIFRKNQAIRQIKKSALPAQPLKIFMDCGGIGGERLLHRGCKRVLRTLRFKGFMAHHTIYFSYFRNHRHAEQDWAKRLENHLELLFGEQ